MILTIRESGLREIQTGFKRLEGTLTDLRPVWPAVLDYFHEIEEEAWRTEGGSGAGGKWKALSDNPPGHGYASWKATLFARRPILYLTGLLKDSLTGVASFRTIKEPMRLTEESLVPYAKFHATGTKKMPQRSPVSITRRQAENIGAIVGRHIQKDIRKHVGAA